MLEQLKKWDSLSQVVFIHDYLQLVFQENRLNVYNPYIVADENGNEYAQEDAGYADALVKFIGRKIEDVEFKEKDMLRLQFSEGGMFSIILSPGISRLPEAFEFNSSEGPYVEFNA